MGDPNSPTEWFQLALERAADVDEMLPARSASAGPVYMAGYVIECSLKAYLMSHGVKWEKGRGGHNLRNLWKASGFKLRDLNDQDGSKAYFIHSWSTDLRYEQKCPCVPPPADLLAGARSLASWIKQKTRRGRR